MRTPLVAGNWKMHGSRKRSAALLGDICGGVEPDTAAEVLVCPPFVYLEQAAQAVAGTVVKLGAQNVSSEEQGAFTGEVAADMLVDVGCQYAIVGHSERRAIYAENDASVARKFAAAQNHGLLPILCVGETLEEKEASRTTEVVGRQLRAVLDLVGVGAFSHAVVAYEPVWAIGTGHTATPEQAQDVHAFIRGMISSQDAKIAADLRLLYGGSVKGANAAELFAQPDIDGGLIGGASLKAGDFLEICHAAG